MIDLSALDKALATLRTALGARAEMPGHGLIRDACIKRFAYCFDLSHKALREYLSLSEATDMDRLAFPDLVRLGLVRGILSVGVEVWEPIHAAWLNINECYEEEKAVSVSALLPRYLDEALDMSVRIKRRMAYLAEFDLTPYFFEDGAR